MSVLQADKELRTGLWSNYEAIQNVFCLAPPSVNYRVNDPSGSTDPFSGKTNKFAESKIVRIATRTQGCYILFGDADMGAVSVTNGVLLPPNTIEYFLVDPENPYLRVIRGAAGADITVSEVY